MIKKIIIAILSALIPTFISTFYNSDAKKIDTSLFISNFVICLVISFITLLIVYLLFEYWGNPLHKYRGQWVEELTLINENHEEIGHYIGIGIITYDRKTEEYTFFGKTFDKDKEIFDWGIDYLKQTKDNSMQYICFVQSPRESSIGSYTFANKYEASGNIWVIDGLEYTHNSYRVTAKLIEAVNRVDITNITTKWYHRLPRWRKPIIKQVDYPKFALAYLKYKTIQGNTFQSF